MRIFCLAAVLVCSGALAAEPLPVYNEVVTPQRAVELAVRHNPDPALADLQLAISHSDQDKAASESRLKVAVGGFATSQNTSMIYASGTDPTVYQGVARPDSVIFKAMAMLPLYTGGLLEHRLAAAEKAERSQEALRDMTLREVAWKARQAYYLLAQARAGLNTAQWDLEARQELLRLAQEQFKVGRAARYVVVRAEAEVADAQQSRNNVEADVAEREATLKATLGVSTASHLDLPSSWPPLPPAPDLEESLKQARQDRPDLVAATFAMEAGDRNLMASLADYSPKVYLVGMTQANTMQSTNLGYSVGLVLSFPLADGGLRASQEDRARAELDSRKLQLQKLELQLEQQVASSLSRYRSALSNSDLAEVEVSKAEEELRVSRLRFQAGRSLYLELLDGTAALARARRNQDRALFQAHLSQAQLLYAMGKFE